MILCKKPFADMEELMRTLQELAEIARRQPETMGFGEQALCVYDQTHNVLTTAELHKDKLTDQSEIISLVLR